ncbi:MAG: hypothetical protein KDA96_07590 [Planctomycetaceae bacterium]|nr:hypothetical protein [Planctomycetaceae bacterium]
MNRTNLLMLICGAAIVAQSTTVSAQQELSLGVGTLQCPVLDQPGIRANLQQEYSYGQPFVAPTSVPRLSSPWWRDDEWLWRRDLNPGESLICPKGMDLVSKPTIRFSLEDVEDHERSASQSSTDSLRRTGSVAFKAKTDALLLESEMTVGYAIEEGQTDTRSQSESYRNAHAESIGYSATMSYDACRERPLQYWQVAALEEWKRDRDHWVNSALSQAENQRIDAYESQLKNWDLMQMSPAIYESRPALFGPVEINYSPDSSTSMTGSVWSDVPTTWGSSGN